MDGSDVAPQQLINGGNQFDDIGYHRRHNGQRRYNYMSENEGQPLSRDQLHSMVCLRWCYTTGTNKTVTNKPQYLHVVLRTITALTQHYYVRYSHYYSLALVSLPQYFELH